MLRGVGKYGVFASREGGRQIQTRAGLNGAGGAVPGGGGGGGFGATGSAMLGMYDKPILEGFVDTNNDIAMRKLYRDIYLSDPIAGAAVDLQAQLPFSDFTLSGLPDQNMLRVFAKSLEAINVKTLLPELACDYQVDGAFIGYINFDNDERRITSIMPQHMDSCELTELPIYGRDPIIDVKMPANIKKLLDNPDPRIRKEFEKYGEDLHEMAKKGKFPLDPKFTLYIARRTFTTTTRGTSYYRRIIPIWLMEKALLRGTIDLSYRRQKSILHLMAGDEEWEPTNAELTNLVNMFISADVDPTGAIVATRPGIQTNEVRCLAGSTLIHQKGGLRRIDKLVAYDKSKGPGSVDVNLRVKGIDGKYVTVNQWHYQGKRKTIKLATSSGPLLDCTDKHKLLTVDSQAGLTLTVAGSMLGKYALFDTKGVESGELAEFSPDVQCLTYSNNEHITLPSHMTPDLAYLTGIIVSEGYMNRKSVELSSTDAEIVEKVCCLFKSLFGYTPYVRHLPKCVSLIKGRAYKRKAISRVTVNSTAIVQFLEHVGVKRSIRRTKSPAYYKQVPWSVLQGTHNIKAAFLAAYADGDGSIINISHGRSSAVEISFFSRSRQIMSSIKAMLADMGMAANWQPDQHRVVVNSGYAGTLYNTIKLYMALTRKTQLDFINTVPYGFGIPADLFIPLLKSRVVKVVKSAPVGEPTGTIFMRDDGSTFMLEGGWGDLFRHEIRAGSPLSYARFDRGEYKNHLTVIKQVSKTLYRNLLTLFTKRYRFEKITSIKPGKLRHTYDLSVANDAPIFQANGVLVKNSGADFWRYDEIYDFTSSAKMRALGISEAFLSAEATFNNMETSLSVFLEQIRAFRDLITRKIFYQRLFPLIATENDFKIRGKLMETKGGMTSDGRIRTHRRRDNSEYYTAVIGESKLLTMGDGDEEVDITQYHMPKLHWHKPLKPEADQAYIEMLGSLSDRGLPIPLRIWAAAGGLPITDIMQSLDEDVKLHKKIQEYKKKLPKDPQAEAADMFGAGASADIAQILRRRAPVLPRNRTFGDMEMRDPTTHKILSRKGRIVIDDRMNKNAAMALANLARRDNREEQDAAASARQRIYHYAQTRGASGSNIFGNVG